MTTNLHPTGQAFDALLDGLSDVVEQTATGCGTWTGTDLLSGYATAVHALSLAGGLTYWEQWELIDAIREMQFGFEPARDDQRRAA